GAGTGLTRQVARAWISRLHRLAAGRSKSLQAFTRDTNMVWNDVQFAGGVSIPEMVSFEEEEPWLHRIVPDVVPAPDVIHAVPTLPAGKAALHEETASGLKIRCDKQGGILEIVDPRMFRPGRETFCRVLSATAISLGGASGVDLD